MGSDCLMYSMLRKILKRQRKLEQLIINQGEILVAKIDELRTKVQELQTALDNEQTQIQTAIEGLQTQITTLQDQLANGVDDAALQEVIDALDGIKTDLEGTIPEAPPGPPVLS